MTTVATAFLRNWNLYLLLGAVVLAGRIVVWRLTRRAPCPRCGNTGFTRGCIACDEIVDEGRPYGR